MGILFAMERCWRTDDDNTLQAVLQTEAEADFDVRVILPARALGLEVSSIKRAMRVTEEDEEYAFAEMVFYRQSAYVDGDADSLKYVRYLFEQRYG